MTTRLLTLREVSNPGGTRLCRASGRVAASAHRLLAARTDRRAPHCGRPPTTCRRPILDSRPRRRPSCAVAADRTRCPRRRPRALSRGPSAHRRAAAMILPREVSPGGNSPQP